MTKISKHIVYLVGAGPGDPGLITVKGMKCLKSANVVVYDRLMDESLLTFVPSDAEKIFVGKERGKQAFTQSEINGILVEKAGLFNVVVRLKGGDPFVFGRGGEEAIALSDHGIKFEIVPGITSSIAAAAYAGIPVTHRGIATNFTVISGSEDPNKPNTMVPWDVLAKSEGTLVILMGWASLPNIIKILTKEGRSKNTPIALIQWGTWQKQKTVTGDLSDIVEKAKNQNLGSPVVAVIGNVVNLRKKINWFDAKPLFGKKILVTRARTQSSSLKSGLTALGAEVIELPTISFKELTDYAELDECIVNCSYYDWIFFNSVNVVQTIFRRLNNLGKDARALNNVKILAVGPATHRELKKFGITSDLLPKKSSSEEILRELSESTWSGKKILIPASDIARTLVRNGLQSLGAEVTQITAYNSVSPAGSSNIAADILKQGVDVVTFASSSTVDNLVRMLGEEQNLLDNSVNICIGPTTYATAKTRKVIISKIAEEPTVNSMIECIVDYYANDSTVN